MNALWTMTGSELSWACHHAVPVPAARKRKQVTFRGWDDFAPALSFARFLAIQYHGERWYLDPAACLKARVPAAWVSCRLTLRTSVSPRDINCPVARYWEGGKLPAGPDYAPIGPVCRTVVPMTRRIAPELILLPCEWADAAD